MQPRYISRILKRSESLFREDMEANGSAIREAVDGSRVLVIGAAGSIGSAFTSQLARFGCRSLHLADISENNLVETVRDLRSSPIALPDDFKTFAIPMGSLEFDMLMRSERPYDYIVNFAALKHVRSEKDPYSLMRMFDTNVLSFKRLLDRLRSQGTRKVFAVSSDKAVNPASVMGATKVFMERVLLSFSETIPFSTARFANVAFSDGSLPFGFRHRMEKRQPIAAPNDVRRYFISHEEAGQLCLLSCFLGKNREIFFPKLDADQDMLTFSEIAEIFLREQGLVPKAYASEEEAKLAAQALPESSREWPCYFFASDTTGEKPYEEFVAEGETVDMERFRGVGIVRQEPYPHPDKLEQAMLEMERIRLSAPWAKADMVRAIRIAVPELEHEEKNKNLDQKM